MTITTLVNDIHTAIILNRRIRFRTPLSDKAARKRRFQDMAARTDRHERRECNPVAFLLILPFALLSGLTTPFSSMPSILQSAMVINPLRCSLDLTKQVYLEGAGFTNLFSDFLPLLVIGLVTLSGAAWLFRRRLT